MKIYMVPWWQTKQSLSGRVIWKACKANSVMPKWQVVSPSLWQDLGMPLRHFLKGFSTVYPTDESAIVILQDRELGVSEIIGGVSVRQTWNFLGSILKSSGIVSLELNITFFKESLIVGTDLIV